MIPVSTAPCSAALEEGPRAAEVRQEPRSARAEAASGLLLRALGGKPPAALAEELSALGPDVIPSLLEFLAKGGVPVDSGTELPVVLTATPELEEQVLSALEGLPREPLLQHLRTFVASTQFEERIACMRVVGRIGTNGQLDLLASLAAPANPAGLVPSKVRAAFQNALAAILARDPNAFSRFPDLYSKIPSALIFPMIRAAEEEAPLRSIEVFAGLLGARSEADPFLLAELARLGDANAMPASRELCVQLRRYLADSDVQRLTAAMTVAGAFDDHEAVPELARLLEHHDPQVAHGARAALGKIARRDFGKHPGAWTAWYQKETDWWRTKSASFGQDMVGSDPVKAAAAVMEIGARRIRRDDAAMMLAEGLVRPEADIVRTCCQAIGHLGSPLAVPALETAAQHADPKVREAASAALAQIRRVPGA